MNCTLASQDRVKSIKLLKFIKNKPINKIQIHQPQMLWVSYSNKANKFQKMWIKLSSITLIQQKKEMLKGFIESADICKKVDLISKSISKDFILIEKDKSEAAYSITKKQLPKVI